MLMPAVVAKIWCPVVSINVNASLNALDTRVDVVKLWCPVAFLNDTRARSCQILVPGCINKSENIVGFLTSLDAWVY